MFCPNCGEKNLEGVKFCSNCGKELSSNVNSDSNNNSSHSNVNKKKGSKGIIFLIIGVLVLVLIIYLLFFRNRTSDNELVDIAKNMNNLKNYTYDVSLITKTSIADVPINMNCKEDNVSKLSYCIIKGTGFTVEEYIDYKHKNIYTKNKTILSQESNWEKSSYKGSPDNAWLNITKFTSDLKSEKLDDGTTKYNVNISSKKISSIFSRMNSKINPIKTVINKDIPAEFYIDSDGYLQKIYFELEVVGVKEEVTVTFSNYNTTESLSLPQ